MDDTHTECLICLEEIERAAPVWQCRGCFTLLHLGCLQPYIRASLAPASKLLAQIIKAQLYWYCPHCRKQYEEAEYPQHYTCYCGSDINPPDDAFLPPHSCGRTCGKALASAGASAQSSTCGHKCQERCHPGACQRCTQLIDQPCYCGKRVDKARCGASRGSCGQRCGLTGHKRRTAALQPAKGVEELDWQESGSAAPPSPPFCSHPCPSVCHDGPCPPCVTPVQSSCACGRAEKTLPCFKSAWQCTTVCGKTLACGNHTCPLVCHSGPCAPCPAAANGARACPCGKVKHPGLPCTEPVPKCGQTCDKPMACGKAGHACSRACHDGPCGSCTEPVEDPCRCGKTRQKAKCGDGTQLCGNKCTKMRNCGRHQCKRRCCPGHGPAPANSGSGAGGGAGVSATATAAPGAAAGPTDVDYCPPCREACGRKLSCGTHVCEGYCHSGDCQRCPIRVTLKCECGRTQITVPCGVEKRIGAPVCTLRCRKQSTCGHKLRKAHACHTGPCPPCSLPCGRAYDRCCHPCTAPCHSDTASGGGAGTAAVAAKGAAAKTGLGSAAAAAGPAPCPPCAFTVTRQCVGRHEGRPMSCSAPSLFKCDRLCGNALSCGKHTCNKGCHALVPVAGASAGALSAGSAAICAGAGGTGAGHAQAFAPCGTCTARCTEPRPLGCTHVCAAAGGACHSGPCPPCPAVITEPCLCGLDKVSISCQQLGELRARASGGATVPATAKSAQAGDAVMAAHWRTCGKRCRKTLRCGHACPLTCHSGSCGNTAACPKTSSVRCPCGHIKKEVPCAEAVALRRAAGLEPDASTVPVLACDLAAGCEPPSPLQLEDSQAQLTPEQQAELALAAARASAEEAARAKEEARQRKKAKESADRAAAEAAAAAAEASAAEAAEKRRQEAAEAQRALQLKIAAAVAVLAVLLAVLGYVSLAG